MNRFFEIKRPENFDIEQIFDCGQCFRFYSAQRAVGEHKIYEGVAFDRYIRIEQRENTVIFYNTDRAEYHDIWRRFFDIDTDYAGIARGFCDDKTLCTAAEYSKGIRILKQDGWEALCSFIISQNNNIPRIKGIIERMSEQYGKKVYENAGKAYYSFPTPRALYDAGVDAIFALKTGFRAKYIYDAAKCVCENPSFLEEISFLDTGTASERLQKIKGVGKKVAACTLLFGFEKYDSFPVDVWVKRILEKYYPDGQSHHFSGEYAGIAQQYLFYYERCMSGVFIN